MATNADGDREADDEENDAAPVADASIAAANAPTTLMVPVCYRFMLLF